MVTMRADKNAVEAEKKATKALHPDPVVMMSGSIRQILYKRPNALLRPVAELRRNLRKGIGKPKAGTLSKRLEESSPPTRTKAVSFIVDCFSSFGF